MLSAIPKNYSLYVRGLVPCSEYPLKEGWFAAFKDTMEGYKILFSDEVRKLSGENVSDLETLIPSTERKPVANWLTLFKARLASYSK